MTTDEQFEVVSDRFVIIPEWVLDRTTSRGLKVYGYLRKHANREGHGTFTSRKTLAEEMNCSVDTVDRGVEELEAVGAVVVAARSRANGSRTTNQYTLPSVPAANLRPGGEPQICGGSVGKSAAGEGGRKSAAPVTRRASNQMDEAGASAPLSAEADDAPRLDLPLPAEKPSEKPTRARAKNSASELFHALKAVFVEELGEPANSAEHARWGRGIKNLEATEGCTPESLRLVIRQAKRQWGTRFSINPISIAQHWRDFAKPKRNDSGHAIADGVDAISDPNWDKEAFQNAVHGEGWRERMAATLAEAANFSDEDVAALDDWPTDQPVGATPR